MTQDATSQAVMIVIADIGSGGAQQVACQVADHWAGQGRRVGLLTFSAPETDFFKTDQRVERISIGGLSDSATIRDQIVGNLKRIAGIRRALRAFGADTAIGFIGPTNVLLVLASIGLRLRVVISERNDPARQSFGRIWDRLRRLTYRHADVVSANSRGAIVALRAYVPERKLVYLPNPLRRDAGSSDQVEARESIILNVGRLHYQKGQDLLIRAFARIAGDVPDWRLCIMGEGDERPRLEALIRDLKVGDRVALLGRVDDPFPWYRRASIFAFPSRWEGTPNALIEAMSCGLPAIVSDAAPGVVEIVRDGREGRVVPADDEEALAAALKNVAQDEEVRRRLGAQAARQAQHYASEPVLQTWDDMLRGGR
jgi:glycosyltransferase involved in cell wall biosynthesis